MDFPAVLSLRKFLLAFIAITVESTMPNNNRMPMSLICPGSTRCMHYYYLSTKAKRYTSAVSVTDAMHRTAWVNTIQTSIHSKSRRHTRHSLNQLAPLWYLPKFDLTSQLSPTHNALRMTSSITKQHILPDFIQSTMGDEERAAYHELAILSAKIRALDEIYYGGGSNNNSHNGVSEVSDDEYDALARRETELCTLYPHLLLLLEEESGLGPMTTRFGGRVGQYYEQVEENSSPGGSDDTTNEVVKRPKPRKVTTSSTKRIKRRHLQYAPMQSLDNAMDDVEAVAWFNRVRKLLSVFDKADTGDKSDIAIKAAEKYPIRIMAEPKIDGLSLSLRFQLRQSESPSSGIVYDFVWGATRGDGTQGEDVTEAVQSAWMRNNSLSTSQSEDDHFIVPKSFSISALSSSAEVVDPPSILEIRGEVVLPQKAFDEFVATTTNTAKSTISRSFSNARNAASGILLRSKEPTSPDEIERTQFLQSHLQFYAYDVVALDPEAGNHHVWPSTIVGSSGITMREFLTSCGFHVPSPFMSETLDISNDTELHATDVPNLLNYHRKCMSTRDDINAHNPAQHLTQPSFPYKIDGVVYKLASLHHRTICGSSSRTPRWAIAHKFPPLSAVTRLLDIEVQVGRTGALTPVAILDPVDLGGVMVARASLHNFHFARKMLLLSKSALLSNNSDETNDNGTEVLKVKKGISVLVSRAGDVIPQVMKRVFDDDDEEGVIDSATAAEDIISLESPHICPACGSPTTYEFVRMPPKKEKISSKATSIDEETMSLDGAETNDAESGQILRCSGPQLLCHPRAMNALAYAYSRPGLDVKGLSKSKLNQLFEAGIISFPSDLFTFFGAEDEGRDEGRFATPLLLQCTSLLSFFPSYRPQNSLDWQCSIE